MFRTSDADRLLSLAETIDPDIIGLPEILNSEQAMKYSLAVERAQRALDWFGRNPQPKSSRIEHDKDLLTPSEVATMFRVDVKTVARWAKTARLEYFQTPGGHRRYSREQVERLAAFRRGEN